MHVLNVLPDDRLGGPQIRSRQIAADLRDRGVETSFAVPDTDGDFPAFAREEGFTVHTLPFQRIRAPPNLVENARFLAGFRSTVSRLESLVEEADVDVVHANVSTNFQGARAGARSDAGLVWHFNDTLTPAPVRQVAAALAQRWADTIAVAADAVERYYFPRGRAATETLYAPVDVHAFDVDAVDSGWPAGFLDRETPPERPVVGTIGNLNPAKGHDVFVRAIDRVRQEYGPVIAPIVGQPLSSRRDHFRKLQRLVADRGLEDTVHFCGYRGDVPEVLSTFDVFVLSSVTEACPIVVLEAMAMERAVVATDVGGVREQLRDGEHGMVVPPSDPDAMADEIAGLLADPDGRERLGSNARRRACEAFSLETIADRTREIYEQATQ